MPPLCGHDPGQGTQGVEAGRQPAGMLLDHGPGAGVEGTGAAIVAQALPSMEHVVERGRCQGPDVGEPGEKGGVPRAHRGDRGLLQHHLAHQHGIRVRASAGTGAPRQVATGTVVPGEEGRRSSAGSNVHAAGPGVMTFMRLQRPAW